MVCIYCGSATQVSNSRPQTRLRQTWRRRVCTSCDAIFTTNELADFSTSLVVRRADGSLQPFSRDKLFLSLHRAVGHRRQAVEDAGSLTATVMAKLLHAGTKAAVTNAEITETVLQTLKRFDTAAAIQYAAYHATAKATP